MFIGLYGKPERVDSTEYDVPRPPLVTRIIEYRPENVKIAFAPNARVGEPPPYKGWFVIGYIDTASNKKILKGEVARRLRTRLR